MLTSAAIITMLYNNASQFNLYFSARAARANIVNEINIEKISDITEMALDKKFMGWVSGGQISAGISPWSQNKNIRHEVSYYITDKKSNSVNLDISEPTLHALGIKTHSLMFNTFYDFKNNGRITPYVGAGIGMGFLDWDIMDVSLLNSLFSYFSSESAFTFSYALIAGAEYKLNKRFSLDLIARYFDLGKIHTTNRLVSGDVPSNTSVHGMEFAFGIRYTF